MPESPRRRAWWRRKRAWAALALWLVIAYPLAEGPALYGVKRGWWDETAYVAVWRRPLDRVAPRSFSTLWLRGEPPPGPSRLTRARRAYLGWWSRLGAEDAASD